MAGFLLERIKKVYTGGMREIRKDRILCPAASGGDEAKTSHTEEGVVGRYFGSHELQDRGEEPVEGPSDRKFGYVLGSFFGLLGCVDLYLHRARGPLWLLVAALFILAAFLKPGFLAPLNRLWLKIGLVLYSVINPIVLALLFYLCITPIGLIMRLLGKDLLNLRRDPTVESYWIQRRPPGPTAESLKNQF